MWVSAIIQARVGSTRLPGKVLKEICGKPVLVHVLDRIKRASAIDEIIVATTDKEKDDIIVNISEGENVKVYRGSEYDVLKRYYMAAQYFHSDVIVRITSDNPLTDYRLIDKIVENLILQKADYSCNNMPPTYPYGLDCECFSFNALKKAFENAKKDFEREHVTPYIRQNRDMFSMVNLKSDEDYSHLRLTLDTLKDYEFIKNVYENLYYKNREFTTEDVINFLVES